MKRKQEALDVTYIDTSGLHCPLPIINCKASLDKLNTGERLLLKATDVDIFREISLLVKNTEYVLLNSWKDKGSYFFQLERIFMRKKPARSPSNKFQDFISTLAMPAF